MEESLIIYQKPSVNTKMSSLLLLSISFPIVVPGSGAATLSLAFASSLDCLPLRPLAGDSSTSSASSDKRLWKLISNVQKIHQKILSEKAAIRGFSYHKIWIFFLKTAKKITVAEFDFNNLANYFGPIMGFDEDICLEISEMFKSAVTHNIYKLLVSKLEINCMTRSFNRDFLVNVKFQSNVLIREDKTIQI